VSTPERRALVRAAVELAYPGPVTYRGRLETPFRDPREGIPHVFHVTGGFVVAWLVTDGNKESVVLAGPPTPEAPGSLRRS